MTDHSAPSSNVQLLSGWSALPNSVRVTLLRLIALALIVITLSLTSEAFLTSNNVLNVLRQTALLFLLASGLTIVILTAGLDLSVGANIGLSACLAATIIKSTGSISLALLVGMGSGFLIGLINGGLIAFLRIPPFIATYGMLWILHGVTYWFMGGETIHGFPAEFRAIGSGYLWGIPIPVFLMLAFLLVGMIFLQRTRWGQDIYSVGANREAARLSGIPVNSRLVLAYVMSGLMAGLASLIFLARLNSAEGDIGEAMTLPAIAAVLIGGTSLFGGMNLLSINASWQPLVTGVIVIAAVYFDNLSNKGDK